MFKKITKHRMVSMFGIPAIVIALAGFGWSYFSLRGIPNGAFILHFNDVSGITRVGGTEIFSFMGIFGVLVTVMNFIIALEFDARDRFFGKYLAFATLVFAVLLFIAFWAIISVNV
jgi:hypothetical protein